MSPTHLPMEATKVSAYQRYQELQQYVNWTAQDARRVESLRDLVRPKFSALVADFYAEIENHPEARKVITGGDEQIARLKETLVQWLAELFSGQYDRAYVERRWRAGFRHVAIGLNQVYTNAALSRLRRGLLAAAESAWQGPVAELLAARESLNMLIDLDLAIIEDAYQMEFQRQSAAAERLTAMEKFAEVLAHSERRYRALFENSLDGLLILSDDARIVAANPAACAQAGFAVGALDGQGLDSVAIVVNHTPRAAAWSDFFGGQKNTGECRLARASAAEVDIEFRSVASFAPGLHLLSLRDVTARKQAEEKARQAGRLAAIGETMAALVHESRNALQRSKASLEMLTLEVEDRPEAIKLVARAQRAQEDLHRLYEEVRQWAAPLHLRREACDLRELWKEVWCQVNQAYPTRAARLEEEIACDALLQVDRFAMSQVFRNIFENALEASPPGAAVKVKCSAASNGSGAELCITIEDHGPGLSAEQQQRIFEPFFTTKSKGTGLGMAIVQRIIHSHGGEIAARSPCGAQIAITLPRGAT